MAALSARLGLVGMWGGILYQQGYDVSEQRDFLADRFLASDATHLFFVDDDMGFRPDLVERKLAHRQPLVATACPHRAEGNRFNVLGAKDKEGAFIRAEACGAGLMLIAREVFERKLRESEVPEYVQHGPERKRLRAFFRRASRTNGERIPEDWSFCLRWGLLGGETWVYTEAMVEHVGPHVFRGRYADAFKEKVSAP